MSIAEGSIRWIDLSEEEKLQVRRIRNAESARRSRQKKKAAQEHEMRKVCDNNKVRLDRLEKAVHELSHDITPKKRRSPEKKKDRSVEDHRGHHHLSEERPHWFGDPF